VTLLRVHMASHCTRSAVMSFAGSPPSTICLHRPRRRS